MVIYYKIYYFKPQLIQPSFPD